MTDINEVLMSLQNEIDSTRKEIRTDGYPMSIGEWISLYEKKEIDIHPEFQRFYRWTITQKTKFIESLLLGIPIPPIFVLQRKNGIWDVIDGLQRLSTIFEFVGILKNEEGKIREPLILDGTKYLPSLSNKSWDSTESCLDQTQRLLIKREKLFANIIMRESDDLAKYELFMRINTGGSPLSTQEVRNCILIQINRKLFYFLKDLANHQNFQNCISITDKAKEEQYDLELVLRFLIFRKIKEENLDIGDVNDFITNQMISLAKSKKFDYLGENEAFTRTFNILAETQLENSFKRYDKKIQKFIGGFLLSAFEVVAFGLGHHYELYSKTNQIESIREKVVQLWDLDEYKQNSGSGVRASSRIPKLIPLGRKIFAL